MPFPKLFALSQSGVPRKLEPLQPLPGRASFLECELCINEMRVLSTPLWPWFLTAPSTRQSLVPPGRAGSLSGGEGPPFLLESAASELSTSSPGREGLKHTARGQAFGSVIRGEKALGSIFLMETLVRERSLWPLLASTGQ